MSRFDQDNPQLDPFLDLLRSTHEVTAGTSIRRPENLRKAASTRSADRAAHLRITFGVSSADAHIGAVLDTAQVEVSILTGDVNDLRRIVQQIGKAATVVRI
jgi:hypothetical protein